MECSKCGYRRMTKQDTMSSPSGLLNDGSAHNRVTGFSCIICGNWIEEEFTPVQSYHPKTDRLATIEQREAVSIAQGLRKLSEYDFAAWKFRKSIEKQIAQGTDVENIAFLILKTGKNLTSLPRMQSAIKRYQSGRLAVLMERVNEVKK